MTHTRPVTLLVAGAATCAALLASSTTAQAEAGPKVRVLNSTVAAPFQLQYAHGGLLIADGGTSKISKLNKKGLKKVLTTAEGLGAVGMNKRGDIAYGIQQGAADTGGPTTKGDLVIKLKKGGTKVVDLLGYDKKYNPDGGISYGIDHPTACQRKAFAPLGGAKYSGGVDSHPYAVTPIGNDAWVVADAGGNDLLKVGNDGTVSTIAVLGRQPVKITAEAAKALGLPDCVVGAVYNFESVPTDVEVVPGGLLVSLLPGGPEDPSLGGRGSVHFVTWRGSSHKIAGGFLGATNLAVGPRGTIYVAELFGGQISRIQYGRVTPYVKLANALSLEYHNGTLYAGTLAPTDDKGKPTGPGTIVAIR